VRRRSEYELARARDRAHILEGLLKALDMLDEVIATIRRSRTADTARDNLIRLLKITEIQARAILDMQLRRLAALERKAIEDEYKEKIALIQYIEGLLNSPEKMREVIAEELRTVMQAYSDPRRTIIVDGTATSASGAAMLVPQETTWVTLTVNGLLGRSFDDTPPRVNADVKEPPRFVLQSTTTHILYLLSTNGQCATIPVHQLPQVRNPQDGTPYSNLCGFKNGETIAAVLSLPPGIDSGFLFFATAGGEVKRLRVEDMPGMMANVFKVIDIEQADQLGWVFMTKGDDEVILVSAGAQAIRFKETDVRPTGLGAGGMRGIKLAAKDDRVVGAGLAREGMHLWTITNDGIAKTSPLSEYPVQGRAGSGVIAMKVPKESAGLAAALTTERLDETLIVLTTKQRARALRYNAAPAARRAAKGDFVISLSGAESVAAAVPYQPLIEPAPLVDAALA